MSVILAACSVPLGLATFALLTFADMRRRPRRSTYVAPARRSS